MDNSKTEKNYISVLLFYISYIILLIYHAGSKIIGFDKTKEFLKYSIPALLLVTILIQSKKYLFKSIMQFIIVMFTLLISYYTSSNFLIFFTLLFIFASKNIDMNKFIKLDFISKIVIVLSVIILYKLGLTEVILSYRKDGTIRNSLGFGHPNVFGAFLFSMAADMFYLNIPKNKIIKYIIYTILLTACTLICDSRAAQLGIIMIFLSDIFYKKLKNCDKLFKVSKILPWALLALSLTLAIFYSKDNQIMYKLNEITSTRIRCAKNFYDYYGVNLFGHFFEFYGQSDKYYLLTVLDNAYVNILIQFGLLATFILLTLVSKTIKYAYKNKEYKILICFIIFLIYALMENYFYYIAFNTFLIYIGNYIYSKEKSNEENSNNNISLII